MSGAIATTAILGGVGLAGSLGGAALASNAAGDAASTQANAADKAAQLQYQASQNALGFQQQQWQQSQQNMAPWLQMGGGALGNLGYLMGITPNTSLGLQPQQPHSLLPGTGSTPVGQIPSGTPAPTSGGGSPIGIRPTAGAQGPIGYNPPTASPAGAIGSGSGSAPLGGVPTSGAQGAVGGIGGMNLTGGPQGAIGSHPGDTGNASSIPGSGFGSLMTPYQGHFEAPTGITMQNDPGYQERLNIGGDILQRSAAARGGVLTGGTAKALDQFGQDYASNEYNNVYNRALTGFQTNYNQYNNDQNNQFNRLAAISGIGQTAANNLSSAGQNASNNVSNNLLSTAANMGQQYNNAGAANASGIVGSANAWGGALGGLGGNLSNLYMLQQLQNMGGYGGGGAVGSGGALPTGWA
jgi:hypothetical protein